MTPRPLFPWRGDPLFNHNLKNLTPFIVCTCTQPTRTSTWARTTPTEKRRLFPPATGPSTSWLQALACNLPPPPFAPNPHKSYQFTDFPYSSLLHSLLETTAKTRPTSSPAVSLPHTTFPASPRFVSTHTQIQSQYPTAQSVISSPTSFSPNLPPPPHPPPIPPRILSKMTTRTTAKIRNQILYLLLLLQNQITTSSYTLVWTLDQQYI